MFWNKKQPEKKLPDIRYGHPSHEDFNRRLAERQSPPPGKSWIDQPWVPPTKNSSLPNLRREFDKTRDPLIAKQMEDMEKSEKQRRDEQTGRSSSMIRKDKPFMAHRPAPDQRQGVDRQRFANDWLVEQRDAAMARAAPNQTPRPPDHGPNYIPKGPSQ